MATPCRLETEASSRSRTARQAACTAPPDIHVWRLAEVDPAEPMPVVAGGASTTSSTPSTSRVICCARVTKPCPTSTAGAGDRGHAVLEPAPRRRGVVEATRVHEVLDADGEADAAPDAVRDRRYGRRRRAARARAAVAGPPAGRGAARTGPDDLGDGRRARQHLAGDERVAGLERVAEPYLDRVHPERAASLSIWASWAKHACTAPKPLIAPQGGLLVRPPPPPRPRSGSGRDRATKQAAFMVTAIERRQVGAAVEDDARLDLHEPALGVGVVAVPHHRRVPVDMAEKRLLA